MNSNLIANFPPMSIRHPLAVILCMFLAMALLWSKALIAIIPGILAFVAVTDIQIKPFRIEWLLTLSSLRRSIRERPYIWVFSLFFFLYLLSGLYAGNLKEWWSFTHVKIPFLIMALSFGMLDYFSKKDYMLVSLPMILLVIWSSILIQFAYFQNFELFNVSLGYGSSLPTPGSHIRFSSIVAISMVLCIGYAIENWTLKYKWERWVYAGVAVYLFYFLHLLSVRSGIVQAYVGICFLSIMYIRKLVRWKQIALAIFIVLAPLLAYHSFPGFEKKVHYSIYDLKQFHKGEGDLYSDSQRWDSWHAGIILGNRHPIIGTGTGNFRAELEEYYSTQSKSFTWRPQNQWINIFAILGLLGLTIFLLMLIYPMTFPSFWITPMIPVIFMMQVIIMMVEHPLDTAVGTALFLLFTLMGLSYQNHKNQD